jgi:tetratricopeptide (TPR) repeat protein
MTTVTELLSILAADGADRVRESFKASARTHSEDEFSNRLSCLLLEADFFKADQQDAANSNETIELAPAYRPRAGRFLRRFIPIAFPAVVCVGVALLSQNRSVQLFSREILTEITESKSVRNNQSPPQETGSQPEGVERLASALPDRLEQPAVGDSPRTVPSSKIAERLDVTKAPSISPIDEATAASTFNLLQYYRDKGLSAYRAKDLHLALVYFNLVIEQDPQSSDGYINRGIVHYRLGDTAKAFADINQAKRIDEANEK